MQITARQVAVIQIIAMQVAVIQIKISSGHGLYLSAVTGTPVASYSDHAVKAITFQCAAPRCIHLNSL